MDIQSFINMMNEKSKIESGKEYNLGNLIEDLKPYKNDFLKVEFDDGSIPDDFDSWRGSYCELALGYTNNGEIDSATLSRKAYNANGAMYEGYKGGEFTMDLNTPIHQDNYGEYGNRKIIGIEKKDNKLIIKTRTEED